MHKKSLIITETSTKADKPLFEVWERSNRLSFNFMKPTLVENVGHSCPQQIMLSNSWECLRSTHNLTLLLS
ncbi:hypothetical protein JHK85_009078 [Glycine max]|nr:hypothetical protein JHK85_009078 [Glycine max]KHN45958.1 hypothetical protein glysoja_023181 [Glycine soja]